MVSGIDKEESTDVSASPTVLSRTELWDVTCLVVAFSCVVANLTLVVGTGPMVILSIGGSASLAPFAFGVVFLGMSAVSLTATHWIFAQWGRKFGFWVGCGLGIVGALVGCWGLVKASAMVVLLGQFLMGGGLGIGMYLRYFALEVVPLEFSPKAVSWVLGGGCVAAFIGPEISQATKGVFGHDSMTFVGTFVATGCFFILQTLFVGLVGLVPTPSKDDSPKEESRESMDDIELSLPGAMDPFDDTQTADSSPNSTVSLWSILSRSSFLLPLGVSILAWIIMIVPMAVFRLAMKDLGFTERQSLTIMEFHFLGKYAPGFWSGTFIKKHGFLWGCVVGLLYYVIALCINLSVQDNTATTAAWFLGLFFAGVGWNFAFASTTVWSTQCYQHRIHLKPKVQAAHEFCTFFVSGGVMFTTGYLYQDVGGGFVGGWRLLNATLFALIGLYGALLSATYRWNHVPRSKGST